MSVKSKEGTNPAPPSTPQQFQCLYDIVRPYTLLDEERLRSLFALSRELTEAGVEGDMVECGVCNGGSSAILASGMITDSRRRLWLYDTFEGIPAPAPQDGEYAKKFTGKLVGSIDKVNQVLDRVGFPSDRTVFRKGLFEDTFQESLPEKVALLHIDADWLEGHVLALNAFYSRVSEGGFVILDDFGHWEGARKGFYAFCRSEGIEPLIERVGSTQAFWRKGQAHNRDILSRFRNGRYLAQWEIAMDEQPSPPPPSIRSWTSSVRSLLSRIRNRFCRAKS